MMRDGRYGSNDAVDDNAITVRLFVKTQTYDIPCDPRHPAQWLLQQARKIYRTNLKSLQKQNPDALQDELEVLYNRTRRQVIDLQEPIGKVISPMDVIDARTLLQTPDLTNKHAMFPWLRSYPGSMSDESLDSTNGLFFQQLYAFTLIGKRTPPHATVRRQQAQKEHFLSLMESYMKGTFDADTIPPSPADSPADWQSCSRCHKLPTKCTCSQRQSTPQRSPSISSSGSYPEDSRVEPPRPPISTSSSIEQAQKPPAPAPARSSSASMSPAHLPKTPPRQRPSSQESPLNHLENVFDIVFKQQAIGMKLGSDESKQFAIVKECFEGSEARRYPEIQNGVVILAVNGQEVTGMGLSRILYRLREAPRPVVVRFGRLAKRS